MTERIEPQTVREFQVNGAAPLRGLVTAPWLDELARGVEKNLAAPGPYSCSYTPEGEPGGFVDDYCNWQRIDEYRAFALESGVAAAVAELMGSRRVRLFHEHVLVKEPGTREVSPWHQDQPYYCVDGEMVLSLWVPLDPVPVEVSPGFVSGSHRWGRLFTPRKFADHRPYDGAFSEFEPVPDIDAHRADYEILSWALEPGDAVAFHMKTVHGAPGTSSLTGRRRAVATRWLGDDAVFATRPFETSPPFPGLALEPGQPMEGPLFPVAFDAHG